MFLRAQRPFSLQEIILTPQGASATLRDQILFFEIDWDLKPEINIHTLHRTEHLIAIYFKDRVVTLPTPREWGESGD